jgi:hypothetical protein
MSRPLSDRLDAYFDYLKASCPPTLQVWTAATEGDFCTAVERAIEAAILQIESGARRCGSMVSALTRNRVILDALPVAEGRPETGRGGGSRVARRRQGERVRARSSSSEPSARSAGRSDPAAR